MNEKWPHFGRIVKIANDVFTNEIEIAPGTYTAMELLQKRCQR